MEKNLKIETLRFEKVDGWFCGLYNQIEVFEDKIFVFDRTGTEKLFIFRKNGKFLKSIGEKGGAPFEFFKPRSFAIDREKSKLLFMTIRNGSGCIFL